MSHVISIQFPSNGKNSQNKQDLLKVSVYKGQFVMSVSNVFLKGVGVYTWWNRQGDNYLIGEGE